MVNLVVGDLNISDLDDDTLLDKLREFNLDVGPIVDSTRAVYQRKLARILRNQADGGDLVDDDYSDTDEGETEELKYSSPSGSLRTQLLHGSQHQSFTNDYSYNTYSYSQQEQRSIIQPRVSLDQDYLRSRSGRVDDFVSRIVDQEKEPPRTWQGQSSSAIKSGSSGRSNFSAALKLTVLVVIFLLAFLVYQNMESSDSSPIPEIGEGI